jgi:glutamate carboxypeptidase
MDGFDGGSLRARLDARSDEMLEELERLVSTESPSGRPDLLVRSAEVLATLVERLLGSAPVLVDGAAGPHVHWVGRGATKVLLVGHHDTVFPEGTASARPFAVANGRATGPGVFDMKSGIVQALFALAEIGAPDGVELLVTSDEETGSATSRDLIVERARAAGAVLVLEPSADGGALKVGRKGVGTFTVAITGRASHAGLEPEKGVNALVELASQVPAIAALSRPELGTTVTPTVATAGTAENVVPARASITVDVRVASDDERRRVEGAMAGLVAGLPGAVLSVSGSVSRPPMHESAAARLFEVARRVAPSVGVADLTGVSVGGGSDGNFTAAAGVPTLDGLGAVGGGAHADHEWVDVASMGARAALVAALVGELVTG